MKKMTFKKGLLIYTIVLLLVIGILLLGLRRILVKYEKAQAYNLVESFVKDFEASLVFSDSEFTKKYLDFSEFRTYEDSEKVLQNYLASFSGMKLEYSLSANSFDSDRPVYIIHSGDVIAGELELQLVSEEVTLDMLSIPNWKISSFKPELMSIGKSYAITAPKDYSVYINNIKLGESEIASEEDGVCIYMAKGLLSEPEIVIKDEEGIEVS